jgi:16S rRNA C1402 N4-methylase RsmH
MTLELGIIIILVGALGYSGALLRERNARIGLIEQDRLTTKQEAQAYLNRLLQKHGNQIVFEEDGTIITNPIQPPDDDNTVIEMVPPFAAAERQWQQEEDEENAQKLALDLGISLSDLPEETKARLRADYNPLFNQSN